MYIVTHPIARKRSQKYCFFSNNANFLIVFLQKVFGGSFQKKVGVVSRQRPTFVSRGGKTSLLNTKPPQIANQ